MPASQAFSTETDTRVMQILITLLDELGGPGNLIRHHKLQLLPALVEAAYVLVLQEEEQRPPEEIADSLGITRAAVEAVLSAPMSEHPGRVLESGSETAEYRPHTAPEWSGMPESSELDPEALAGGVAKFAYEVVNRREDRPHS